MFIFLHNTIQQWFLAMTIFSQWAFFGMTSWLSRFGNVHGYSTRLATSGLLLSTKVVGYKVLKEWRILSKTPTRADLLAAYKRKSWRASWLSIWLWVHRGFLIIVLHLRFFKMRKTNFYLKEFFLTVPFSVKNVRTVFKSKFQKWNGTVAQIFKRQKLL